MGGRTDDRAPCTRGLRAGRAFRWLALGLVIALGTLAGAARTPAAAAPYPGCTVLTTLRPGMRGAAVQCLEEALRAKGYQRGWVDGYFGNVTTAAVKAFQRANGLAVDGIAGRQTLGRLGITGKPPAVVPIVAGQNAYPIPRGYASGFAVDVHATYPAADIMAACGTPVVSPAAGVLLEVDRVATDFSWQVNDGFTRGGLSITIRGDDGVRYYLAHFSSIRTGLAAGQRVAAGQAIAAVGTTGASGACHVHFGLSPTCPGPDWWVRRGVVWPARYLTAWRNGTPSSPATAVNAWAATHPNACSSPAALGTR
jgi:peptidoglycan hydrolase-like protein with peptidoglycan-binding domain